MTVDDLIRQRNLVGPFLLKLDCQGAELDVVAGAESILEDTDAVVMEVSLFNFFQGGADFSDTVIDMKARGFVAYDIVGGHTRPFDRAPAVEQGLSLGLMGPIPARSPRVR